MIEGSDKSRIFSYFIRKGLQQWEGTETQRIYYVSILPLRGSSETTIIYYGKAREKGQIFSLWDTLRARRFYTKGLWRYQWHRNSTLVLHFESWSWSTLVWFTPKVYRLADTCQKWQLTYLGYINISKLQWRVLDHCERLLRHDCIYSQNSFDVLRCVSSRCAKVKT